MESPDVFWKSHALVRSLLTEGSLSGLRIDHIDGLFDPERYLLRLQWAHLADLGQRAFRRMLADATNGHHSREPSTNGHEAPPAPNEHAEWNRIAPEVLRLLSDQVGLPPPGPADMLAILGPEISTESPANAPLAELPGSSLRGMQP